MLTIKKNNDKIGIYNNNALVIKDLIPVVNLQNGDSIKLSLFNTSTKREEKGLCKYVFQYVDEENTTEISLIIRCVGMYVTVSVKAKRIGVWHTNTIRFDSDMGISINMKPIKQNGKFMATNKYNNWWTRPAFCEDVHDIPSQTQSLLWKESNQYLFMTSVCGEEFKSSIFGNEKNISVVTYNGAGGYTAVNTKLFVLGISEDPFKLISGVIRKAFQEVKAPVKVREEKRYPEMFKYLGWCTWDAFYRDVNEEGLIKKAKEFKSFGIPVKWFILDDGWQQIEELKLKSIYEEKEKFPDGLYSTIDRLKDEYGIRWMGIWHAMLGHWNGIHSQSELYNDMKNNLLKCKNDKVIPLPDSEKAFSFYTYLHNYLSKCGIDFIKVDGQSALSDFMRDDIPIGKAARELHKALDASVGIYFDGCMINCMGMASEQIFNRPSSSIARNSDDFYPKKENNFRHHAVYNAFNSLTHSNAYWGDWDMFWTKHTHAKNNSILRAISGGPIYTSDPIGETIPEIIWPLILKDGRILRCDKPGLPTSDSLLIDHTIERVPLKIWNQYKKVGIIAAFNVNMNNDEVLGSASPNDIPSIKGERFVVFNHFNNKVEFLGKTESISFSLPVDGVALFSFIPLEDGFGAIGLINKYISAAAIKKQWNLKNRKIIIIEEGGLFGFVTDRKPLSTMVNGKAENYIEIDGYCVLDCSDYDEEVCIEIVY